MTTLEPELHGDPVAALHPTMVDPISAVEVRPVEGHAGTACSGEGRRADASAEPTTFPSPRQELFALDNLDVVDAARRDPEPLVGGSRPVILDEVQREPELLRLVKRAIDRGRVAGRFQLTGSANLQSQSAWMRSVKS